MTGCELEGFEKVLKTAADRMPKPEREMKFAENGSGQRQIRIWRPIPAVIILCLVLIIGTTGVIVYAYNKLNCGWNTYLGTSWAEAEWILKNYNMEFSETYDEYEFESVSKLTIVPQGTSFWEVFLFGGVYEYAGIEYKKSDISMFSIDIGSTEDPYWTTCFGYLDDGEMWDVEAGMPGEILENENREYEGRKLWYGQSLYEKEAYEDESLAFTMVTWVEEEKKVCVSICVNDLLAADQMFEYVEGIIDDNR